MLAELHSQYEQVAVTRGQTESQVSNHISQFVFTKKSLLLMSSLKAISQVLEFTTFSHIYFTENHILFKSTVG